MRRARRRPLRPRIRSAILLVATADDETRRLSGPTVGIQDHVDIAIDQGTNIVSLQGFFDDGWNIVKLDLLMQKRLNRHFVGRIEDSGQRSAGLHRFEPKAQTGEAVQVRRFKGERADVGEVQRGQSIG
jgi:hypothetical protein